MVRLTDCLNMTKDVYCGSKTTTTHKFTGYCNLKKQAIKQIACVFVECVKCTSDLEMAVM